MPGVSEFGEIIYVLGDLLVAKRDDANDLYETPISLAIGQSLMVEPETDSDDLRSYGTKAEGLRIPIGSKITLSGGALDRDAFYAIAGFAGNSSGTTPNQVVTVDAKGGIDGAMPYFGVIGVGVTTSGGKVAVGLQKCKLDNQPKFSLDGSQNKFVIQEIEGYGFVYTRSSIQMNIRAKFYETDTDWTAPANGTDFKAFFTAPAVS